jgi:hypothetical protein
MLRPPPASRQPNRTVLPATRPEVSKSGTSSRDFLRKKLAAAVLAAYLTILSPAFLPTRVLSPKPWACHARIHATQANASSNHAHDVSRHRRRGADDGASPADRLLQSPTPGSKGEISPASVRACVAYLHACMHASTRCVGCG